MPLIAEIAAQLVHDNLPVLLPDTCALLDVVREVTRKDPGGKQIDIDITNTLTALKIVQNITAANKVCNICVSSILQKEFDTHLPNAVNNLQNFLDNQQKNINNLDEIAQAGGLTPIINIVDRGIVNFLENAVLDAVNSAVVIEEDERLCINAHRRVIDYLPPSRQGKESYKDCLLFEEYLRLTQLTRQAGGTFPIVFITSNTTDFCEKSTGTFRPEIVGEASAIQLTLCQNWQHVKHELKFP